MARLNSRFDDELLPDSLRVRYRIYGLSVELMKFDIARKPTYPSRSLILEVASIEVFFIKSGLFEQPLKGKNNGVPFNRVHRLSRLNSMREYFI
ncbi:hypothetical protein DP091_03165 [Paenibacillus sp. MDMC362]|nr:hypothetical protein DP091_03165 [Paenibacillus sp. MDMC362]